MKSVKEVLENFKIEKDQEEFVHQNQKRVLNDYFSPYLSVIAVYNANIKRYKTIILSLIAGLILTNLVQEFRIQKVLKKLVSQEITVLPVPNFMKIRPGEIPDEVLMGFSDYAAKQIESFDYTTVEEQYHDLEKYMTPQMKAKFIIENKNKLKKYLKMSVVQYFTMKKPDKIYQKIDPQGDAYYEATYQGSITRYTNDQKLKPFEETFIVRFETSSLENPNRMYFFNIRDMERHVESGSDDNGFETENSNGSMEDKNKMLIESTQTQQNKK